MLPAIAGRAARALRQSLRDPPRGNMSPVWIVLALLPILGGAERFNCRTRILGAYYADVKSGCKAFHVCVRVAGGGIRDFRFFCPPGTLFHQEAQTCTDWGDDDPLACPADIYDGQFDLYKIGSGFDTKKIPTPGNREDEAEFSLQRAETGDRRLSQNNGSPSGGGSDLRAAHSSDFFSGQRDRGRDDPAPQAPASGPQRQSFRRATTSRPTPSTTQYTTVASSQQTPPANPPQYDLNKRKLIRKRPIYTPTTLAPTTYAPTTSEQTYTEQQQQNLNRRNQFQNRQYFNPTTVNVPPQYREEYVEVSRVTPKQNRFFPNSPSPSPFSHSTPPQVTKKEGLVEIYNYEAQSTPGFQSQNENRPFKVRNSFNIAQDVPREPDFVRTKNINSNYNQGRGISTTTADYSTTRGFVTSTPAYRNFNSVSYEPEKNNFAQFSGAKQNYYSNNNSPSTLPTTTTYATTPAIPSSHFNTVAYNTNLAFNTQASNYAENDEDDGQYRPPQGEDDGQYRPELYEKDRELLSGAHSLNIAASSGNRLPEEQKLNKKQILHKSNPKAAAVPRPFRPPPTPFVPSTQQPEVYTTTVRPQTETSSTQRAFDYYQTYTTTSRPYEPPSGPATTNYVQVNNADVRITTTSPPRNFEQRVPSRETLPPTVASTSSPRPPPRPHFANPSNKKEDSSYDYAYYDSDPGFSEYDHIEEFGRTKSRV